MSQDGSTWGERPLHLLEKRRGDTRRRQCVQQIVHGINAETHQRHAYERGRLHHVGGHNRRPEIAFPENVAGEPVDRRQFSVGRAGQMDEFVIEGVSLAGVDGIIGERDVPVLLEAILFEHGDRVFRASDEDDAGRQKSEREMNNRKTHQQEELERAGESWKEDLERRNKRKKDHNRIEPYYLFLEGQMDSAFSMLSVC